MALDVIKAKVMHNLTHLQEKLSTGKKGVMVQAVPLGGHLTPPPGQHFVSSAVVGALATLQLDMFRLPPTPLALCKGNKPDHELGYLVAQR